MDDKYLHRIILESINEVFNSSRGQYMAGRYFTDRLKKGETDKALDASQKALLKRVAEPDVNKADDMLFAHKLGQDDEHGGLSKDMKKQRYQQIKDKFDEQISRTIRQYINEIGDTDDGQRILGHVAARASQDSSNLIGTKTIDPEKKKKALDRCLTVTARANKKNIKQFMNGLIKQTLDGNNSLTDTTNRRVKRYDK